MMFRVLLHFSLAIFAITACRLVFAFSECNPYTDSHVLSLAQLNSQDTQVLTGNPYSLDITASEIMWQGRYWHAAHEYSILDYPGDLPDTPISNGHLHQTQIGYRQAEHFDQGGRILWQAAPTMAVSSNQWRHSENLQTQTMRLDGFAIYQYPMKKYFTLSIGGCLGALSGEYELLPVVAFTYDRRAWFISAGYPHAQLRYALSKKVSIFSQWSLFGREWEILDADFNNRSMIGYSGEELKAGIAVKISKHTRLGLYWQRFEKQRLRYRSNNLEDITTDLQNSKALSSEISFHF